MHASAFNALIVCVALVSGPAAAACKLESAEVPIYMSGQQPYVSAGINGTDVRFLLDTGAMFSTIAPAARMDLDCDVDARRTTFVSMESVVAPMST